MSSLKEIREAITWAVARGTQMELHTYPRVQELGELPAVIVSPAGADFMGTMGMGTVTWKIDVFVIVDQNVDADYGQEILDDLIAPFGPNSIPAILFPDDSLGLGEETDAVCTGMRDYGGSFEWMKVKHIGAVLEVEVVTDGRQ